MYALNLDRFRRFSIHVKVAMELVGRLVNIANVNVYQLHIRYGITQRGGEREGL